MRLIKKEKADKLDSIERCFFDAEHGWITLSLDRLDDLKNEFPSDPQVLYAEALIRKGFLGQGIKAEDLFLEAQCTATNRTKENENYLLSSYNSAKYARNIKEYIRQEKIFRKLAPNDPDILYFDSVNHLLEAGNEYANILNDAVVQWQHHAINGTDGDIAAFAEIALISGEHNINVEIGLRTARYHALRQLDKVAESSRKIRGEGTPPNERLALKYAMAEINNLVSIESNNHMFWNEKTAWHILLREFSQALSSADRAIELCPHSYYKPKINKATALVGLERKDEALCIAKEVLESLKHTENITSDNKIDKKLAETIIHDLSNPTISNDFMLIELAKQIFNSVKLTRKKIILAQSKGKPSATEDALQIGLEQRVRTVGNAWNKNYIMVMAEFLMLFPPEISLIAVIKLCKENPNESGHCINAVLYIIAHAQGVMRRDACRFFIYLLLGTLEPEKIRKNYRESILGPTAVGSDGFENLECYMLEEMERLNPELIRLIAKQPPLNTQELEWARNITMARFTLGVDRDPEPQNTANREGFIKRFFKNLLISRK